MKNIFKIFILIFVLCFTNIAFAQDKVQDVFSDIDSDYKYLNELQNLYDRGVILPDVNGNFNPNALLSRDDFVGIAMEVSCHECVRPGTAFDYILNYSGTDVFFDINESNDNFYCVAEAKATDVIRGYDLGYKCDDGSSLDGENPFCTKNNITLEEALAILLREASVFSIMDNNAIISQIEVGMITNKLANDLSPTLPSGGAYTFYGYFKKALELQYTGYDIYGNEIIYKLVEPDSNGNLNPKIAITRERFLTMAYILLNFNSCSPYDRAIDDQIYGNIEIYDASCKLDDCELSSLDTNASEYTYYANVDTTCELGMESYNWMFYNVSTGATIIEYGQSLIAYKFLEYGNWEVKLLTRDNCGNSQQFENMIGYYGDGGDEDPSDRDPNDPRDNGKISVSIIANPTSGDGPLDVDFTSIVNNCIDCSYNWDFGDGNTSENKNPSNTYKEDGVYRVVLRVIDRDGNYRDASVVIVIGDGISGDDSDDERDIDPDRDTDGDGIPDVRDLCPLIPGPENNQGCPIIDMQCDPNDKNSCNDGYICNVNGYCKPDKDLYLSINALGGNSCLQPLNNSSILGGLQCNSCPCEFQLDFAAEVRKCDILIPAIVSPNGKEIYSRGGLFEISGYDYGL